MRLGTRRDPVVVLIFILLTCGIYYLYFIYAVSKETQDFEGSRTCARRGSAVVAADLRLMEHLLGLSDGEENGPDVRRVSLSRTTPCCTWCSTCWASAASPAWAWSIPFCSRIR